MTPSIKYWQSKFRILADWQIRYEESEQYTEHCCIHPEKDKAVIYPGEAPDYVFHEIIHICQSHLRRLSRGEYKVYRKAEEQYVQDLCAILNFLEIKWSGGLAAPA